VSSPITFSNFNNIDFNLILNSVMQQESQPLQALQTRQSDLSTLNSQYATLATRLGAIESAADDLSTPDVVQQFTATVSDPGALTATASAGAVAGRYEIVVNELARAQVTASATTTPDTDTTIVASGGQLTIGGVQVTISGNVTLKGLVDQINGTAGVPATASIVQTAPGQYRLVLTGTDTGTSRAFTIVNGLTGGAGLAFSDTNGNGVSGDSAADNAVQATDASLLVNNLPVTSASNTLTSVIPGTTVTLTAKDPAKTVVVTVSGDNAALIGKVQSFVTAYNALVSFANDQSKAAAGGQTNTLAHDSVLRELRDALRSALLGAYGSGTFTHLAEVGLGFDRNGNLTLDTTALNDALGRDPASVTALFAGTATAGGAFSAIQDLVRQYTQAGGFLPEAQQTVQGQIDQLGRQIADMQDRLAVRRAALLQEYIAADQAMTALKAQSGSLASFGSSSSGGLFSNF